MGALIKYQGWWQGSLVEDHVLREHFPSLPNDFDFWVLASQTCNLFNEDFKKIPVVEWVGARNILDACCKNPKFENGQNPRILQCRPNSNGEFLDIQCDINARVWTSRFLLQKILPFTFSLRDCGNLRKEKQKEIFIGWLARSYIRLELSDELAAAFKLAKITPVLNEKLTRNPDEIYGIFLIIAPDTDDPSEEKNAIQNPSLIFPPCNLEIVVVVYNSKIVDQELEKLKKIFSDLNFESNQKSHSLKGGDTKINRFELAREAGITITEDGLRVVTIGQWTVEDMRGAIRYSFVDFLSDTLSTDTI